MIWFLGIFAFFRLQAVFQSKNFSLFGEMSIRRIGRQRYIPCDETSFGETSFGKIYQTPRKFTKVINPNKKITLIEYSRSSENFCIFIEWLIRIERQFNFKSWVKKGPNYEKKCKWNRLHLVRITAKVVIIIGCFLNFLIKNISAFLVDRLDLFISPPSSPEIYCDF